jgi:hypothetical protein
MIKRIKKYYITAGIIFLPLFILYSIFPKNLIGFQIYIIYMIFIAIPFITFSKWLNND